MSIKENLLHIKSQLPPHVTLVAVSKTKTSADILAAYEAGQRLFGENYVQELVEKHQQLPKDIQWHFIGHLQSRKVKLIAPFVSLIHGVDSLKLLQEINKQAAKNNRIIDCLLQIHIAEEDSKFGLDETELEDLLKKCFDSSHFDSSHFDSAQCDKYDFENIRIVGLMGMATFTDNLSQIEKEFKRLKTIFDYYVTLSKVEGQFQTSPIKLQTLSMGMSGDFQLAIKCGSNMVRIGSSIFGARSFN